MIYALAVILTLLLSTAVVVAMIGRAPLLEDGGEDVGRIDCDTRERSEDGPDEATSVGAAHAED